MAKQAIDFTLKDRDGQPHDYIVHLHPATEGQEVFLAVMRLAGQPLASLLDPILKGEEILASIKTMAEAGQEFSLDTFLENDLKPLFANLNLSKIVADTSHALSTIDICKFAPILFKYTMRDKKPLSERVYYDEAYQGNYGEYSLAAWRVIRENGFLCLPGV